MRGQPAGIVVALSVCLAARWAEAAPRDVQIRSIDIESGVIELFNFGATDIALDGWRFCTHDDNQTRRYSGSSGLNGVTIEAGTSFFIHFNNDSPGGPDHRNRSAVGSFATPLDAGPYAIGLYFAPVNFGNGNTLADHLQWNIGGSDNSTADERSDEAQSGGVWANQSEWIATTADTVRIVLTDDTSGVRHGAGDYGVIGPALFGDADGDNDVDLSDLLALQPCFSGPAGGALFVPPTPECLAVFDSDSDGDIDLADWLAVQASFTGSGAGGPTAPPVVSFANQIQPIFNANCIVCHTRGGFADAIMHLNADESFAALVGQPSVQDASLPRVVPADSSASLLFLKVSSDSPPVGSRMPLGGAPLSQADIALIRDWIDQGAPNN